MIVPICLKLQIQKLQILKAMQQENKSSLQLETTVDKQESFIVPNLTYLNDSLSGNLSDDQSVEDVYQQSLDVLNDNKINYGSMIPLCLDSNSNPRYVLGPHYFIFLPALLLCAWFLYYCIQVFHQKLHFGPYSILVCILSGTFFLISYIRVGLSNPGIASSSIRPTIQARLNSRYCRPCKVLRINKTRHCQFCNVCILEMDHHCVWVGKCIGQNNLALFKLFLFSALLTLLVFAVCVGFSSEKTKMQIK